MKHFKDPYSDVPLSDKTRFVSMVASEDYEFFCSVRPIRGTVQTTINIIFKWLIQELNKRNITDWSKRQQYEQFITTTFGAGCPGPSTARRTPRTVLSDADAPAHSRRSKSGDCADTSTKGLHPNKKCGANGGSRGQGAEDQERKTAEGGSE